MTTSSLSQNFGDPSFYLIDSLNLDEISINEKELLDTTLVKYHNTIDDTLELSFLLHIVDQSWDPEIWPRYNELMVDKCRESLAIHHDQQIKDKIIFYLASGIANIGYLYDERGDLLRALDYYHKGLSLYEQIGNAEGQGTCYNNLGVIYSITGDKEKALEFHNKSLEFKKQINDLEGVAMSYNNMGTIYETEGEPFVALEYYDASLAIREEIGDRRGIAMSYDNIGDIYFREGVYGKALDYYQRGYNIWIDLGIGVGISTSLNNLANVHLQIGQTSKAKEYAIESYQIAEKLGFPVDIENSAKTLVNVYKLEKNYKKALEYSDIFISMREKIKSDESAQEALKKSLEYEYQKMALQDSLEFQKEKEVQDIQLQEKETQAYALYIGIGLLVITLLIGIRSYQQKRSDNKKIAEQKLEVETQKKEIEKQHVALAANHQEISDSISYAKRIQEAILPPLETVNKLFPNSFVFYRPKDVVSGDFYWIMESNGKTLFAAADCTGHGVPGAMVSVVCHNALNRVVRELKIDEPAEILNKTRDIVVDTFSASSDNVKDGMDISICSWDKKNNTLEWAGANNPLYIIRSDQASEAEIIKPDKQPIGSFHNPVPFTNNSITLNQGDTFFLFTDGYMDQFGGEHGKKFKYSRFKDLILSIRTEAISSQGKIIERTFDDWKRDYDQLDDVCVIGVQI